MVSMVYQLMYLPSTFLLANPIIQKFGAFVALIVGVGLIITCCWIRLLVNHSFWWLIVSSIIGGTGQPFLMNTCTTLSNNWFPTRQRPLATTLGVVAGPLGSGFGYIWPILFVTSSDPQPKIKDQVFHACLFEACLISACMVFALFFIRNNPKLPPSASGNTKTARQPFIQGIKCMSKEKNMWLLFFAMGMTTSLMFCLAAQSDPIIEPFGLHSVYIYIYIYI